MQQIHQYPPYLNQGEGLLNIIKMNNETHNMIREKLSELTRENRILETPTRTSSSHLNPINIIPKLPSLNRGITDSSISNTTTHDSYSRVPNNNSSSSTHKQSSFYDKVTKR
jgi:hypothetical protein